MVYEKINKQHEDLLKHLRNIGENNQQIQKKLGEDFLKEKI